MSECIKYLDSFEEVSILVSTVQERRIFTSCIMEHYRGQGRPEYKLIPSISRGINNPIDIELQEKNLLVSFVNKLKKQNIDYILRQDSYLTDKQNLWNTLFQAQHLGMPTRLLDWSAKWEDALWFAVEDLKNDDVDGQFWILTVPDSIHLTDTRDSFLKKDLVNLDKTYLINAPIYWSDELSNQIGEIRRQRQYGKFTISPYNTSFVPLEEQPSIIPHLEKYYIRASAKQQIRHKLELIGIRKEWLYYRDANKEILAKLDKVV
jgi:hypothetical protein